MYIPKAKKRKRWLSQQEAVKGPLRRREKQSEASLARPVDGFLGLGPPGLFLEPMMLSVAKTMARAT